MSNEINREKLIYDIKHIQADIPGQLGVTHIGNLDTLSTGDLINLRADLYNMQYEEEKKNRAIIKKIVHNVEFLKPREFRSYWRDELKSYEIELIQARTGMRVIEDLYIDDDGEDEEGRTISRYIYSYRLANHD